MGNIKLTAMILLSLFSVSRIVQGHTPACFQSFASDCQVFQENGHTVSGVYHVAPRTMHTGYDVYCDMVLDGGGWLMILRRIDGSVDFYRNWTDYQRGFGDVSHEHWIGLLPLRRILSQGEYELRVDLQDWEGNKVYAKYNEFDLSDSGQDYTLTVDGYEGTAGDGLKLHNGRSFTTRDRDNGTTTCAVRCKGAWWYEWCHNSNLNGIYFTEGRTLEPYQYATGVHWLPWRNTSYSLKTAEMKIRRA